jgi:hypothetical protein
VPTTAPDEKSLLDVALDEQFALDPLQGDRQQSRDSEKGDSGRTKSSDVLRGSFQGRSASGAREGEMRPSRLFGSMSSESAQQQQRGDGTSRGSFAYDPVLDDPEHESQKQVRNMSVA